METENKIKRELNAVTKKVTTIIVLTLILIMPLTQVETQLRSRKEYEVIAQNEVAKGWGKNVTIGSPKLILSENILYPTTSETNMNIESKEKKRGVFFVPIYLLSLKSKFMFSKPISKNHTTQKSILNLKSDYILLSVYPIDSIQNFKVKNITNGKELKAMLTDEGIKLPLNELTNEDVFTHQIEIEMTTRGTGLITYESNSDLDKVRVSGNWKKPKFSDEILPTDSKLSSNGFEAQWTLNSLPKWEDGSRVVKSIGIHHLWVNTDYSKIEKTIKYGVLFISLTFLLVFILEFISGVKVHPLQYGLIGLTVSIFYLLLLAISEATGFNTAYLISSFAVTGLIVFYVQGFLKQKKFIKMILGEQIILSSFFYILLSLEERAFLIGSIGLFIALAIFMTVTRNFDWYSGTFKNKKEEV